MFTGYRFKAGMSLFRNALDFRNSNFSNLDVFSFMDALLMFIEKSEVVFSFSEIKQAQFGGMFIKV